MTTPAFRHDRDRYEILIDGEVVGYADAIESEGRLLMPHTVIDPGHGGQGLGGTLVRHVLDEARARELQVIPQCPFVKHYIDTHPEYADLVG